MENVRNSFFGVVSIAVLFVLAFFAIFIPLSTEAATFSVTTTDDELDSTTDCTDTPADCSLREAISEANTNADGSDTILLATGTYTMSIAGTGEDNNATGDFDILDDITIVGVGSEQTIIDADSIERIFHMEQNAGYALDISNMTLQNGADLNRGGAIYAKSDLTVDGVVFSNNASFNDGGAIYSSNVGEPLTITDSLFDSNTSEDEGGALYVTSDKEVRITNTVFDSNSAQNTGGAIRTIADDVQITNTLFFGNDSVASEGGAIRINEPNDVVNVSLSHVTIAENTAASGTAGISVEPNVNVELTVSNSIIANNRLDNHTEADCYITTAVTFTSNGYNVIGNDDGCDDSVFVHASDLVDTDPLLDTELEYKGGTLDVLGFSSDSSPAIDIIPEAACLDAGGAALTEDIREYTRPENGDCDSGAYELDQTDPSISLDPSSVTLECSVDSWSEATATVSDNFDISVSDASVESSDLNEDAVGSYSIVYATDSDYDGNFSRATQPVTVEDTIAPVITVTGTTVTTEAGEDYTDSGVSLTEVCDTSLSVTTTGSVDTDSLGEYTLTYSAEDASSNTASVKQRTVTVEDTTAPVLTLSGESSVTLTVGDSYTDAGATGTDSFEGDITESITTTGSVDTETAGTYTIVYSLSDTSGNEADSVSRTVTVQENDEDETGDDDGDVDNDPDSGEGDGSDDTEESLGAVVELTKTTDSTVTVEYENGSTKSFQLFNSSAKAKVQLHTNGEVLIAINKKYMRTFNAFTGEQLDQVKLFKNKQYKTKFKRFNIYKKVPGKNNVMVLAQTKKKHKKQFKLRSFVVKNGGAITKRPYRTIRLNNNTQFSKLKIAKNKKNGKKARVLIKRKGKTLQNWKYRVTKKKGIIKKAI